MNDRPNILYVFGDQWRAGATGFEGNPEVHTPHLDALAGQSLRLNHCIAGSPVCCVWRASMLTGVYPHRHGVFLNDGALSPEARTFGETFAEAGYDTAWVGKWHVDGHGRTAPIPRSRRHGFEHWRTLECTHDYHHALYYADDETEPRVWPDYDAISQTDDVIAYLESRSGERPFLAFLSWGPPHNPYETAPEAYRAMYDASELTLPPNVPEHCREQAAEDLAGYYAHCSALDACMGRLLAALDRQGLASNTIVVFTSDHGDYLGSHGLWDKCGPWEPALRVPMLIRDPRRSDWPGRSSDVVLNMVDHLPTLCAMAGVAAPAGVQGRDLSGHLAEGTTPADNDALYASYWVFGNWYKQREAVEPLYRPREARGIRTTRHTYVEDRDGPWLLYDNHADPHQLHNLVAAPNLVGIRAALARRLGERLAEIGDDFEPGEALFDRFYPGEELGWARQRRGE